jgi:hypothetical protein
VVGSRLPLAPTHADLRGAVPTSGASAPSPSHSVWARPSSPCRGSPSRTPPDRAVPPHRIRRPRRPPETTVGRRAPHRTPSRAQQWVKQDRVGGTHRHGHPGEFRERALKSQPSNHRPPPQRARPPAVALPTSQRPSQTLSPPTPRRRCPRADRRQARPRRSPPTIRSEPSRRPPRPTPSPFRPDPCRWSPHRRRRSR